MKTPKNITEALRLGFAVKDQVEENTPDHCGKARGKMRLVLDALGEDGQPGCYELIIPYTATYHFGKPREARANEKF